MPESTETFTCAGSFLRTEGFLNEVLLNSQMSFACVPECVFSSFGSTQIFVRHSGLDETLTEGGLEGNFIRQIPESDRNSECHHWVQQRLLRRKYVESNLCFQPRMFRPFTWVARWSKSFPIRFWQTRFWSFLPGFRVGLKGMNLTWMKVSLSACRLADFSAYPDAAERNYFPLAKKYRNLTSMCFFISNIPKSMGNKVGHT